MHTATGVPRSANDNSNGQKPFVVRAVEKPDNRSKSSHLIIRLGAMPQLSDLELKREIGRSIAEARIRRGLSQKQLADRLGCSEANILDMEHGRSFPRFRTVAALSRELGVPLRDLVDQVEQPDPSNDRRARLELRGRALLNGLSDEFLEIAIEQLSVLAQRGARSTASRSGE